jgi:hypothetical protein
MERRDRDTAAYWAPIEPFVKAENSDVFCVHLWLEFDFS